LADWLLTTPRTDKQVRGLWQRVADVTVLLDGLQVRRLRQAVAAVTVLVGLVVVYFVLRPPPVTLALEGLFVVVAVALAFQFLPDKAEKRQKFQERLVVFLSVLVGAGVGAIIAESFESPSFDEARIGGS
jgi:hypothetical protein